MNKNLHMSLLKNEKKKKMENTYFDHGQWNVKICTAGQPKTPRRILKSNQFYVQNHVVKTQNNTQITIHTDDMLSRLYVIEHQ